MSISRNAFILLLICLLQAEASRAIPKKPAPPDGQESIAHPQAQSPSEKVTIAYLAQVTPPNPALPFFLARPDDDGEQGALLGVADNNTTGRFTGQNYVLETIRLSPDADPSAALKRLTASGIRHILVNAPADTVTALGKLPEASQVLIYDVGSSDDRLRGELCAPNLLHLLPSRTMRTDALMQYLSKKRWQKIFLVTGPEEPDKLYAAAVKRSAQRFGTKIVGEKNWRYGLDDRRTPETEIPTFTQGVDYDVLVVADERGDFGDLLSYRSWLPRPVAGTQGLVPLGWHFTHEQWGALQLQKRFQSQAKRFMGEQDYAAWLAVRSIGEAASRVKSAEFDKIRSFMLGGEFALAGFKGVPLSFRPWDGQLRQPVLLATERSLVAVAPIEGFLHKQNELDTLGYDQAESACHPSQRGNAP